jgi:hypothetical protein
MSGHWVPSLAGVNFALLFAAVRPMAADSNLPACCRRLGQHGCTMAAPSSGPAIQAALCPMYPRSGAVPAQAKASATAAPASTLAPVISHPEAQPQTESYYRVSYSRTDQKRGPPAFLA